MSYRVELTPSAKRDFDRLREEVRRRVVAALIVLGENPRPPKVKRLAGSLREFYRIRVGDFRIIYSIQDEKLVVSVVRIGDRKDVYR